MITSRIFLSPRGIPTLFAVFVLFLNRIASANAALAHIGGETNIVASEIVKFPDDRMMVTKPATLVDKNRRLPSSRKNLR
jgi:hypothetical protein